MNESDTRAHYIDPALHAKGWRVVPSAAHEGRMRTEFQITTGPLLGNGKVGKALKADYVLQYRNRNVGIVEAKADTLDFTEGVAQAKDYAMRMQVRFTYSTNGKQIYCMDMLAGTESEVAEYPTPEELWEMTVAPLASPTKAEPSEVEATAPVRVTKEVAAGTTNENGINWHERLFTVPFEDRGGTWQPRYYQDNAITNVLDAVASGQDRILLTLATGTGKTAIAFQIAWKLFHARWNLKRNGERLPRILFLADRNILADQAYKAFSLAFEETALVRISPKEIKKKGKVPTNGSLFFTIFQTFMSGGASLSEGEGNSEHEASTALSQADDEELTTKGTPYFGDYEPDFFDFIIIDECHRGGGNDESSWRDIMEYFSPAVQLGLTATPKRDVNGDTYKYFGDPVYIYSLKEGINDGFLTPFRYKEISTTGDEYTYTEGDVVLEGEIDYGKTYSQEEQNRVIEIMEVEKYRVQVLLDSINQKQKTLVFCENQRHALAIRNLINQLTTSKNPNYCHRVTADDGKLGEQHLGYFQDNQKSIPTILTTSQKLSTGVDAPEVRNVVLMRIVRSMVEFKQIIGRGTRLYDGKDYFTVHDFFWKSHKHFEDPEWDGPPLPPEEPAEPRTCKVCGDTPCSCMKEPKEPCELCGKVICECNGEPPKKKVKVQLSNGSYRSLQHMTKTRFWSKDGTPISADTFIKQLFGELPSLFKDEAKLREIWSKPDTRKKLLEELEEKGYSQAQLYDLQELVEGKDSDLFDVLSFVAYNRTLIPRTARASRATVHFDSYDAKQQEFLNFVLEQYVQSGVNELDDKKLPELLELKYNALADAKAQLGSIASIRENFIGFQKWLYGEVG
jgi:type I restriction enzyme R subunit